MGEGRGTVGRQALAVPQGFYFFCWPKSNVALGPSSVCVSASAVRYSPEGTACRWSGQPPAAEALVRCLMLALSTLLYRVIPAQSEPQELPSFARLTYCPCLTAVHGATTAHPPVGTRAQGASKLACRHFERCSPVLVI